MEETARKIKENTSCWYAVYTAPRAEKKVKEQLDKIGVENYLPLQPAVRLWNNRKKKIFIPVVPGCLFVFLLKEKGQYVSIPEVQMETFKTMIEHSCELVEFAPNEFVPGTIVRVISGQLQGLEAELVDCQGNNKLLLRVEGLGCALVTVSTDCVASKEE